MSVSRLLDRAGRMARTAPAVALGARVIHTYGALDDRANRLAAFLETRLGLAQGERVALLMKNVPEYVEIAWGCWRGGFAAVPINAKLHAKEVAYILANSGAKVAFVTPDLASTLSEAMREAPALTTVIEAGSADYQRIFASEPIQGLRAGAEDLAWLFYTSGTTGRPKGAMLSHRNLISMTASYFYDIDSIGVGHSILHPAPLSHGSGCYMLPHVAAAACQVMPESGGFEPAEIFALTKAWPGASMFAAPTMIHRMVNHAAVGSVDLSGLRTIIYGGAPMHVEDVKKSLDVLGPKLAQLYGQGEAPMCITGLSKRWYADRSHPRWDDIIASAGFPQTVVEVAVLDEADRPLPPGEMGEVCARGESVMMGYWDNPAATAETLRNGWLHTGDVGKLDGDGFLTLLDRSKDMVISGGVNIYPREVEEVLLKHAAVSEVSVVGRPHPDWGEEVVAFVVPRPGRTATAAELDALCQEHIARFKRPKDYRFIAELPKNNYGKILKRELRERLAAEDKPS
jgi:long-chain acyl-CoA synthetase